DIATVQNAISKTKNDIAAVMNFFSPHRTLGARTPDGCIGNNIVLKKGIRYLGSHDYINFIFLNTF
ncbi:MAG TPA: hypothetical protein VHO90_18760, partial [Bacteroidales bacterium]|nr:hypothetical protein [Bacteroidales bacterium]